MIPTSRDWKRLRLVDKATYIAQVAASLALLPTVLLTFLTWREARLARADQAAFFAAEKAPRLELASVSIVRGIVLLELRNAGESVAMEIKTKSAVFLEDGSALEPKPMWGDDVRYAIPKSGSLEIHLTNAPELERVGRWRPAGLRVYDLKSMPELGVPTLHIFVNYKDALSNEYSTGFQMAYTR